VISVEDWITIRNLKKKNPSLGTRSIAELLGVSRNTVKKALKTETAPVYERESVIYDEIKPFVDFIRESYLIKQFKVSRILKDLQSKGYGGSAAALYRYIVRDLKPEKEGQNTSAYRPYETRPGEQSQYDWSDYTVPIGGRLVKVYVHLNILGFSRRKQYSGSLSVQQSDVFEALEESFQETGGVCERLQVDNAKVFVENASKEHFRWNQRFLDFCGFYGIKPTRSLPYHPWSKGKVEAPFSYLETHFLQGRSFESFEDFLSKLQEFENEVNATIHRTTKKTPEELFQFEQKMLLALPVDPLTGEIKRYIGYKEEFRKVTSDCLISYGGNRYSVPHHFARSEVWVRVSKGAYLHIYSQKNALIAVHPLSTGKGEVILKEDHYRGYRKEVERIAFDISAKKLRDRFSSQYPALEMFLQSAKAQKRLNPDHNLERIASLFEHYHADDCLRAMEMCMKYNCFAARFVQGYLGQHADKKTEPVIQRLMWDERRLVQSGPAVKRDLKEYRL
jgi:transposase